jgi:hypothetical protein
MPLWDNELMDYWYEIPYKYRSHINLYEKYLFERHFKILSIAFSRPPGGGLKKFHSVISSLPYSHYYSLLLERIVLRFYALTGTKGSNHFNIAKKFYYHELMTAGMSNINTLNFVSLFSRWFVWKYYNDNLALKPIR